VQTDGADVAKRSDGTSARKRRPGKRVENLLRFSGDASALAVTAAINLISHAILRDRIASVIGGPVGQTEARLRGSVAALFSIEYLRQKRAEDRLGFDAAVAEVDQVITRNAGALVRSLTKEYEQADRERRFRGLHTLLENQPASAADPERFYDEDAARYVIAERRDELVRLTEMERAESDPAQKEKLRAATCERKQLLDELMGKKKLRTQTELRAALARQLGESERSVRRLEKQTHKAP
jgi:hypothetical protein